MSTALSNYLGSQILSAALRKQKFPLTNTYFALHTSSPTQTGDPTTEVVGGGYVRKQAAVASWTSPSNLSIAYNSGVTWKNMPACTVTHLALWDAAGGGHMLFWGNIPNLTLLTGDSYFFGAMDFTITLST